MNGLLSFLLLALVLVAAAQATELEIVSDDDLVHIMKRHSYAVVLFCEFKLNLQKFTLIMDHPAPLF